MLSDRNQDGLDDDGRFVVRVADNRATVTMHRDGSYAVADAGFVFRNPRAVLKEAAQSFDRLLRLVGTSSEPTDPWLMGLIKELKAEMPAGVQVVSDHDGNHDGYDDDGRLTFLAGGKAVTLTIGNTPKQVGTITYGATWQTKAPKRVHHPVAHRRPAASPPRRASPAADPPPTPAATGRTGMPEFGHEMSEFGTGGASGRGGEGRQAGEDSSPCWTQRALHPRGSTCTTIRRRQCVQYRGGSRSSARSHAACSPGSASRPQCPHHDVPEPPSRRIRPRVRRTGGHRLAHSVELRALMGIFRSSSSARSSLGSRPRVVR